MVTYLLGFAVVVSACWLMRGKAKAPPPPSGAVRRQAPTARKKSLSAGLRAEFYGKDVAEAMDREDAT
jgi:hypothetical protein